MGSLAGRYVLTGSQNLLMLEHVTESLAGRAAILRLLPLAWREISGDAERLLPWERSAASVPPVGDDPWPTLIRGGFPELVTQPHRDADLWFASYLQTYLERDVRRVRDVGDLSSFQVFVQTLAARSGQMLNTTSIARELGVA